MSIQDRHPTLLFQDLLKNFTEIIPPTIQRKKRESERKMPTRKRTAPIDMRVSRSRLSVAIDPREVFEAQLAAKNPNMRIPSRAPSPAPPAPPIPAHAESKADAPQTATLEVPPTILHAPTPKAPEPAPALEPEPVPAPAAITTDDAPPMHPTFKEPPPEKEDEFAPLPMPSFAEPPPEKEDDHPPMPPRFATPPPEVDESTPATAEAAAAPVPVEVPSAPVVVSPPTPRNTVSPARGAARSRSPTSSSNGSGAGDRPGANLSRSGSSETTRIRGPRGARTQRPQSSAGGMQSMTAGLRRAGSPPAPGVSTVNAAGGLARTSASANRLSYAGRSSSPVNPQDYQPRGKRGRGHAGSFSRRTMASDAEDEVVDKN